MPFDHVALATCDLDAAHRFYTEAVGFELARVDVVDLDNGGWLRHVFYDTGNGEIFALFDLHDDSIGEYRTDISTGLGLPGFVNHIAYAASSLDDLERRKQRLLDHGHDCVIIDHGTAISLYVEDPDGITIEFTHPTRPLVTEESRKRAAGLLAQARPRSNTPTPRLEFFSASRRPAAAQ
jgi:catechol 2,3-dioxygenase-like lactoylglutathione lyase family enzyme